MLFSPEFFYKIGALICRCDIAKTVKICYYIVKYRFKRAKSDGGKKYKEC